MSVEDSESEGQIESEIGSFSCLYQEIASKSALTGVGKRSIACDMECLGTQN